MGYYWPLCASIMVFLPFGRQKQPFFFSQCIFFFPLCENCWWELVSVQEQISNPNYKHKKMNKSSVVITETCEICQTIFVDMKNHNNVVMTDDNNTPFPCCHLFVIEAGWSLYQQAGRKGRWHFVRRTPPFCLQTIHIFGLWEEAVYVEKHLKGPRPLCK